MRKVAFEPEDPERTGICGRTDSPQNVSPHGLSPLKDRTLTEVAENAGSDPGMKQRWYRVYDALCRQEPAEGVFMIRLAAHVSNAVRCIYGRRADRNDLPSGEPDGQWRSGNNSCKQRLKGAEQ